LNKIINLKQDRRENLLKLDSEIASLYNNHKSTFYKGLFAEYLARVISAMEFYIILRAMNVETDVFQAIYIHAISSLLLNLMFFVPMEAGVREGGLYLILGSLHADPQIGIFTAVINRIREFAWTIIGLLIILFQNNSQNNLESKYEKSQYES
jgi:uncharacterized membrane protein YbhN (UPF0104 family)